MCQISVRASAIEGNGRRQSEHVDFANETITLRTAR